MKNRGIKLAKKALQNRPRRFSVIWMLPNFSNDMCLDLWFAGNVSGNF